jgi:hypothetical protein
MDVVEVFRWLGGSAMEWISEAFAINVSSNDVTNHNTMPKLSWKVEITTLSAYYVKLKLIILMITENFRKIHKKSKKYVVILCFGNDYHPKRAEDIGLKNHLWTNACGKSRNRRMQPTVDFLLHSEFKIWN